MKKDLKKQLEAVTRELDATADDCETWSLVVDQAHTWLAYSQGKLHQAQAELKEGQKQKAALLQTIMSLMEDEALAASGVTTFRVDPETQGPTPTLLAHFPLMAKGGFLVSCSCGAKGMSQQDWAEHTIGQLWPQMQEEPF